MIYKILSRELWQQALDRGRFTGAPVDVADGYIHFSTREQVAETARRHFAGERDLILLGIDPATLGSALKWEPSRGGALFPHLYADLPVAAVARVDDLPLGEDGHVFPDDFA